MSWRRGGDTLHSEELQHALLPLHLWLVSVDRVFVPSSDSPHYLQIEVEFVRALSRRVKQPPTPNGCRLCFVASRHNAVNPKSDNGVCILAHCNIRTRLPIDLPHASEEELKFFNIDLIGLSAVSVPWLLSILVGICFIDHPAALCACALGDATAHPAVVGSC